MSKIISASLLLATLLAGCSGQEGDVATAVTAAMLVKRGGYVAQLGGCHDCHTPQFAGKAGQVEEVLWLTGDSLGWEGPWGTTYASNLRLYFQTITEEQWLEVARTREMRPPMPWYGLRQMTDEDLRAIYQFARSLGPAGVPAPAWLPPGTDAPAPKMKFIMPAGPAP